MSQLELLSYIAQKDIIFSSFLLFWTNWSRGVLRLATLMIHNLSPFQIFPQQYICNNEVDVINFKIGIHFAKKFSSDSIFQPPIILKYLYSTLKYFKMPLYNKAPTQDPTL